MSEAFKPDTHDAVTRRATSKFTAGIAMFSSDGMRVEPAIPFADTADSLSVERVTVTA
jgi:hypothetical protein